MTSIHDDLLDIPTTELGPILPPADPPAEPTLAELLAGFVRRVRRRWWLILLLTVVTTAGATLYAYSQPNRFTASAILYFPQTSPLAAALGTPSSQPADTEREANTNVALVTSPSVAAAVIAQLGLNTSIPLLLQHVQASVSSNSDLVSVTATEPDASKAAILANAFAQEDVSFRRRDVQASISQAITQATQALLSLPKDSSRAQGGVLAARLEQLRAAKDVQTGPAQVVQSATAPTAPSSPHRRQIAILGLVLGLILAVLIAVGLDLLDHRLRDDGEIEAALQAPVIGTFPRGQRSRRKREAQPGPLDVAQRHACGMLASCLRLQGHASGTIVLSDVGSDDGQARVALGLAAALATGGRRVIVIQIGSQASGLDRLLGLVDRPGLGAVLVDPAEIERSVVDVGARNLHVAGHRQDEPGPRFAVLPIGYASASYDEISSPAMQDVLWAARSIADVVLVSVASVGETLAFLDTSYTSLLVVGRNRTTREVAAEAITGLRTARAQPQGLVISDADPKQSPAISG